MFIFKKFNKNLICITKRHNIHYHQDLAFTSEITDKIYPKRRKLIKKELTEEMISN
jgi:hypothetical protein